MYAHRTRIRADFLLVLIAIFATACGGGGGSRTPPPPVSNNVEWLIPIGNVFDGGPGKDGIPALQSPDFESAATILTVGSNELAIAVKHGATVKIYPHDIMDWHEIVNDGPANDPYVLSYCPLTGSAMAWLATPTDADSSFGVSGLLYNSNLLLYDRQTDSIWSQMLEISISGFRIRELPERIQLLEGRYGTLRDMYPNALVMTRNTGFNRNYQNYPYGDYRENASLLFPVTSVDQRLHPKTRVIGIRSGSGIDADTVTKAYQLNGFGSTTLAINDQFQDQSIVVVGNTALDFAVIYDRELADGTILTFTAIDNDLPNILSDDEGNVWDAFGTAVTGPRAGEHLSITRSYTAYWFAWVAHFPDTEIHFNLVGS